MLADNLTYKIQKKAYFLFVINLITRSKKICCLGRSLKICETINIIWYLRNKCAYVPLLFDVPIYIQMTFVPVIREVTCNVS